MKLQPREGFLDRARKRELAAGHDPKFSLSADFNSGLGGREYDAAISSPIRTSFLGFPLTARQEINRYNRTEILRKIRALEANLGLITRMKSQVRKYVVGRGIFPIPQTKSPEWNEESARKFDFWANNRFVCDVAGAMTFWERQGFHTETFFAEDESFDALVSSSVSGAPQLQLFDNAEIGGFLGLTGSSEFPGYIDGVLPNAQNRALSYLAVTQVGNGAYGQSKSVEISAADMIHIIRRKRPNQLRAISKFAPGINCAIDKLDLAALTTAAAKLHEALGIVIKKKSGEAGKKGMGGQVNKLVGADGKVTQVNERFLAGANAQYLQIDEEIELLASERPSQNLVAWGNELIRDICHGTGLNFEIVWNLTELGGATARIALADAQWFFDGIQDALNEMFNQRVWVWWCASMMNSGQLSVCPDPEWWVCHWQGPPKLTADQGRTMSAQVDALHAGLDNWQSYYARAEGRFWQEPLKQRIAELAWVRDECRKVGIPLEYIFAPKPGTQVSVDPETGAMTIAGGGSGQPSNAKPTDLEEFKTRIDAYGVAVRAGAITPADTDEEAFRKEANLPPMSPAVRKAWTEDGGFRRPITLQGGDQALAASPGLNDPGSQDEPK
jgi:capsid protein